MRSILAAALLSLPLVAVAQDDAPDATIDVFKPLPPGGSDNPNKPRMQVELDEYSLQSADFIFPSGLRVIMQPDHTEELVGITMWVDNGSAKDQAGREGIAHYIEHLWFKSKHGEDIPMVWDLLAELGCYLNASTSNDWTNYMTVCPSSALPVMMKLESLRLSHTLRGVTEDEMLREREVVRNELRLRYEVGGADFIKHIYADLYPEGHPYHRSTIGTHETLSAITLADIQEFADENYKPEYATIVVVGDFDLDDASHLIFSNFDVENIHPDATEEHVFFYPKEGVENPDKDNPDHWRVGMWDPSAPEEKLMPTTGEPPNRVEGRGLEPPVPDQRVTVHESAIDRPIVAVSWALPGGYRGKDAMWNNIAGTVSYQLYDRFADPNQQRGLTGDERIYTDPDVEQKVVGCFYGADVENSTFVCYAELNPSVDSDREAIAEEMIDQIAEVWNEDITSQGQSMGERFFNKARMRTMREVLLSLDVVSALYGRATAIADWAHYTGSGTYHSDMITQAQEGSLKEAKDLAFEYLTRKRAAISIMEPIPEEQLVLDSSEAAYHGAQRDQDIVHKTATDLDRVTDALISALVDTPDTSKVVEKTLDNGMRVIILPHGEVPVAKSRLVFGGGTASDGDGRYTFAREFMIADSTSDTELDPMQIAGELTASSSPNYTVVDLTASSRNLNGALWILREWTESVRPYTAGKREWVKTGIRRVGNSWQSDDPDWFVDYDQGQHWNPGHPVTQVLTPADYKRMKGWGASEVKETLNQLYQPANTTLIITGKVDPAQAMAQAEEYFAGWRANSGTVVGPYPEMAPPNPSEGMKTLLYDDPDRVQTEVEFTCAVGPVTVDNEIDHVIATQIMDDMVWRALREDAGATYGAGSGMANYEGGSARIVMSSSVQNDAVPLAVETFRGVVQRFEDGDIDAETVTLNKLKRARAFGLQHQSVDQMTTRLTTASRLGWDYLDKYGERLSAVTPESLQEAVEGCNGRSIVTMVGPEEVVAPLLEEHGIEFEVVDWRARGDALLAEHDPKRWKKVQKKRAKEGDSRLSKGDGGADAD